MANCFIISNACADKDQKHGLLKFIIGELIAVIMFDMIDCALSVFINEFINKFNNALIFNLHSFAQNFDNSSLFSTWIYSELYFY